MANLIAVVCFLCGLVAAVPIEERLIGGKDAPDGAFPYVVSVRNSTNYHEGAGAIISDSWILTVAQTVLGSDISAVVAGTTKLSGNGTIYKVSKIVINPNYNGHLDNDIALIQIDGKISFGPDVKTVELPSAPPANGTEVTIAGWGISHFEIHTFSDKLQYINVTIIDDEKCRKGTNTSICTIGPVGRGACYGDNGDPVVSNDVVFGLSAWMYGCANGYPDGHTNVALFTDWIKKVIGN